MTHKIELLGLLRVLLCVALLAPLGRSQTYTYDAQDRLTRVDYADGSSIAYGYDALGNRLTLKANQAAPPGGGGGGGGGGCFIATAAYGSMLDPHVQSLRNFRDAYMLTNAPGRFLIRLYEATSPPIADFIARHEWLRALTRVVLTPIVLAAAYPRLALTLLFAWMAWRVRRRGSRRLVVQSA